mgnify:CR=1 FL=1
MSTIIMTQCWPLQGMNASQKAVLISLADNANDDGVCWPSVAYIAVRTCLSERAVQNAIKFLQEVKILVVEDRNGRSNVYTIKTDNYTPNPRKSCTPAESAPPQKESEPPQNLHPTPADAAEASANPAPRTINNHHRTIKEPPISAKLVIPNWLPKESWQLWDRFRKRVSGKAWTTDAKQLSIESLQQLVESGHDPTACIKQSIERGWTGLFAPRSPISDKHPPIVSVVPLNRQEALEEQNYQVAMEWIKKMQEDLQ